MADIDRLVPGRFYWALPVLDVDTDLEWMNAPQPARFAGLSASGGDMWFWLGVEGTPLDEPSDWPARWVGEEIVLRSSQISNRKEDQ